MPGQLVILSGPSGVGKDTVIDAWAKADPRVVRVIACTTRPPRPGEKEGVDYHFLSEPDFIHARDEGAFLESKLVHGNYYATPLDHLNALLEQGKIAVLKIDVQGAMTAMELRPDAKTVFLLPPTEEELERRLRDRGTEDSDALARRLENARAELALASRYQHRLVNQDVDVVVDRLRELTA